MKKLTKENACFICQHVFDNVRPICYVCRAGGDWQMLCGEPDDFSESNGPRLVHIGHLVDRDDTLRELHDLPVDWQAVRDYVGAPWRRSPVQHSN
jgi:hypothetical protein